MDPQQSSYAVHVDRGGWPLAAGLTRMRLLYAAVFLVLLTAQPLVDPDYFWHLKTGEYILQNGLPDGDIFSEGFTGKKWILHEWLFEIALYASYTVMGPLGVKFLTVSMGMATIAILARTTGRITQHRMATLVAVALGFMVFTLGIAPRPQLVTYLCFALFMQALLRFKYEAKLPAWWLLPVVMLIWVNSHAGYVIGIVLLGLFLACEWIRYACNPVRLAVNRKALLRMSSIAGLTLAATLANPWFIEHWVYPFEVLAMSAIHVIAEWQSPNFHKLGPKSFLMVIGLFAASMVYARRKPDLTELLVPTFFLANAFIAIRHVPVAILAVIPFFGLALSRGVFDLIRERLEESPAAGLAARFSGKPSEVDKENVLLNWGLLLALATTLFFFGPRFERTNHQKIEKALPVHAADFILANGIKGKMFNEYGHGGYLIYRLFPQVKVIIDGRADLYGDKFINEFLDMHAGKAGWEEKFDRHGIDFAVVAKDAPIKELLVSVSGFHVAHADDHYVVLVRNPSLHGLPTAKAGPVAVKR